MEGVALMEQQQARQVEQRLRQNWTQIRYRLLDQFAQVSTADLDAATTVDDLVQRIADRTHHTERYVETRLQDLVNVGSSQPGLQPDEQQGTRQTFGATAAQQRGGSPSGQQFGAGQ